MGKVSYRLMSYLAIAILIIEAGAAGEATTTGKGGEPARGLSVLVGKRVGVLDGTILDSAMTRHLDFLWFEYYDDNHAMESALRRGRLDAIVGDLAVIRHVAAREPSFTVLDEWIPGDAYGFGLRYGERDQYIRSFQHGPGPAERRRDRAPAGRQVGVGCLRSGNHAGGRAREGEEILRMGTSPFSPPFSYLDPDGENTGMDIELARLVARRMGCRLVVENMAFGELIPALLDGRVDVIGACLSITPARMEKINFSDGYYRTGIGAMVRVKN